MVELLARARTSSVLYEAPNDYENHFQGVFKCRLMRSKTGICNCYEGFPEACSDMTCIVNSGSKWLTLAVLKVPKKLEWLLCKWF